ncbi:MAG TPA: transcriptional activator NhaR [Thiolinea sp.]|nr:transcriptional activator NhaR [Thiolinea sp.]
MLNYKHLYYFREVANAGSIARASERLHLTSQTISGQIGLLEEDLGLKLFRRKGRNLELTEAGQVAAEYANRIFQLGIELEDRLQQYPGNRAQLFRVGVSDLVPKTVVFRLLEPAMQMGRKIRIVCTEGRLHDLLAELALQRMELVIADSPMPPQMNIKGYNHDLGSSSISFFARSSLRQQLKGPFPACLDQAPVLIPSEGSAVREKLMAWFHSTGIHPDIVGEFDDNALMKAFGQAGQGVFVAPSVLETSLLAETADMELVGCAMGVQVSFFAISIERRIKHPAILAINESAQCWLR